MGYVYVRKNKTKAHDTGHWKETKKMEAVSIFLATGSNVLTSQQTGVPIPTLDKWKAAPWWKEAVESARNGDNDKLDAKLTKAIDKALDAVMDRIENGDYIYDQKTGKVKQTPVKLRDVNSSFNTLLDKRQLIRKLPTKITEASNTEARLKQLAEQFAKFTNTKEPEEKVIEYIEGETVIQNSEGVYEITAGDTNALHDQRET